MSSHRNMDSRPPRPSLFSGLRRPRMSSPGAKRAESPPVIKLKSPREIDLMREAGRVVAGWLVLDQVRRMAVPGCQHGGYGDEVVGLDLSRAQARSRCFWAIPARPRESLRSPP